jgi:hypothetical protein
VAKSKKAVSKNNKSTSVATVADDFSANAGAGLENVGASDLLVPRLTILQALSPQISKKKSEYISDAEIGDICDVGTGEVFPEGVLFLPVYYRKDYLEWAPRASGEGLINIHSDPAILDQTTRNERKQPVLPNGNLIAETAQFFGLNLTADNRKSFVPMGSTQLKKAKKWLTLATGEKLTRADGSTYTPPLFYRCYHLTTAEESNSEGEWSGWKIDRGLTLPELEGEGFDWRALKADCEGFLETMARGAMSGDVASMNQSGSSDDEEEAF